MGNSLERVLGENYQVTMNVMDVKRLPKGSAKNSEIQKEEENVSTPRTRKSPKPRNATVSSRKKKKPAASEDGESPRPHKRGRRSTCVTIGESANPSLDIKIIKSHLSPLYYISVPAEFVEQHMPVNSTFEVTNGGECKSLQVESVNNSTTRFALNKKHWETFVKEHKLQVGDSVHMEIIGEKQLKIEIVKDTSEQTPKPAAEAEEDPKTV